MCCIFRRADRDELLDLNSPYHRFLVGFENGFSQARSGATHWRIQGKAFGANVFPHIGSARNRFSRIKENFTTFLRKCWLITLHSSAQGIEIRVFFLLIPRNLFGVSPRSVQYRFLDPPVVNKPRLIPSFGGTRRCTRCSLNEEVDRHLAPHPTAMPVLLWVKH